MTDVLTGTANFSASEYERKSSNGTVPDEYRQNAQDLLELLQRVRDVVGTACWITSGYRDPAHNTEVGGVDDSQHMTAQAADVDFPFTSRHDVAAKINAALDQIGPFGQIIYYLTDHHFHIATGTKNQQLVKVSATQYIPYTGVDQIPKGFSEFAVLVFIALAGVALAVIARTMGK